MYGILSNNNFESYLHLCFELRIENYQSISSINCFFMIIIIAQRYVTVMLFDTEQFIVKEYKIELTRRSSVHLDFPNGFPTYSGRSKYHILYVCTERKLLDDRERVENSSTDYYPLHSALVRVTIVLEYIAENLDAIIQTCSFT